MAAKPQAGGAEGGHEEAEHTLGVSAADGHLDAPPAGLAGEETTPALTFIRMCDDRCAGFIALARDLSGVSARRIEGCTMVRRRTKSALGCDFDRRRPELDLLPAGVAHSRAGPR